MKHRRDVNTGGAFARAKPSNSVSHGKSQPDPGEMLLTLEHATEMRVGRLETDQTTLLLNHSSAGITYELTGGA